MGEHASTTVHGVHLVITESVAPFAVGKYTGPEIEIFFRKSELSRSQIWNKYHKQVMAMMDGDDLLQTIQLNITVDDEMNREFLENIFV